MTCRNLVERRRQNRATWTNTGFQGYLDGFCVALAWSKVGVDALLVAGNRFWCLENAQNGLVGHSLILSYGHEGEGLYITSTS